MPLFKGGFYGLLTDHRCLKALRIRRRAELRLLTSRTDRYIRLMAGAKHQIEGGWQSAAPMTRCEASVPLVCAST